MLDCDSNRLGARGVFLVIGDALRCQRGAGREADGRGSAPGTTEGSESEARAAEERADELLDAAESDRDRWERRVGDLTELLNRVREFKVRPLEVEAEMRRIP